MGVVGSIQAEGGKVRHELNDFLPPINDEARVVAVWFVVEAPNVDKVDSDGGRGVRLADRFRWAGRTLHNLNGNCGLVRRGFSCREGAANAEDAETCPGSLGLGNLDLVKKSRSSVFC